MQEGERAERERENGGARAFRENGAGRPYRERSAEAAARRGLCRFLADARRAF